MEQGIFFSQDFRLDGLIFGSLKPLVKPGIASLTQRPAIRVAVVEFHHVNAIRNAELAVELLQFPKRFAGPFNGEEVAGGCANQYRPRRNHPHKLSMIEPCGQLPLDILFRIRFGISNARFDLFAHRSDVGDDGRDLDPRVKHGKISGEGPTT